MNKIKNLLYKIHPFVYLIVSLLSSIVYMYLQSFRWDELLVFVLAEILFSCGIIMALLMLTEGLEDKGYKYKATILVEKDNCYEQINSGYYKTHLGAKFSTIFQIWLMKHFQQIEKNKSVIYVFAHCH